MTKRLKPDEQDKRVRQEYIIAHHPELVGKYINTYCPVCTYRAVPGQCVYHLLPVTTDGGPCPYYTYNLEHGLNARPSPPDPEKSANQPTTEEP